MAGGNVVFQVFQMYVFKCFFWKLRMLQWLYMHDASICFKCFGCFSCMFQVFYLDVTEVYLNVA
jgi:hypothetical protein